MSTSRDLKIPFEGIERIDAIRDEDVDPAVLKSVSLTFVKKNLLLPLRKTDGELVVAIADHRSIFALGEVSRLAGGVPVRAVFAGEPQILAAVNRFYDRLSGSAQEVIEDISEESLEALATAWDEPKDLIDLTDEAPIIKLLNSVIFEAVKERASDIHIEPYERDLDVRFRVDGILRSVLSPPKIIQDALASRIKILADLDIAEKRLPQDGKIRLLVAGKDIFIRVSVIPTSYGDRIVLRLLDKEAGVIGLDSIGLNARQVGIFEDTLLKNNGMVLVTGPTGSGKTTTLYAGLQRIDRAARNVITIEDPIEYQLRGTGQMQVNPKAGLTFARGLRSILRQDPDVIMVGEIRDRETAEIAIQASLTGHLVLSTLHTNDTASAVTRLVEMGIEPFLVASSLYLVLAQRLVRVLCSGCKAPYTASPEESRLFETAPGGAPKGLKLWRAPGCERCGGTGYMGRSGIYELMSVGEELRSLILKRQDSETIKKTALRLGMKTLLTDGLSKAAEGVTSLEEVLRVVREES
ncbi:MAG: type II secretion system ATPase GspE [Thermodesulfobacteriota bacterium]|nr:MAG: type II secretion system ATPase GspE [Thermodesulfobacteriota bacterium]